MPRSPRAARPGVRPAPRGSSEVRSARSVSITTRSTSGRSGGTSDRDSPQAAVANSARRPNHAATARPGLRGLAPGLDRPVRNRHAVVRFHAALCPSRSRRWPILDSRRQTPETVPMRTLTLAAAAMALILAPSSTHAQQAPAARPATAAPDSAASELEALHARRAAKFSAWKQAAERARGLARSSVTRRSVAPSALQRSPGARATVGRPGVAAEGRGAGVVRPGAVGVTVRRPGAVRSAGAPVVRRGAAGSAVSRPAARPAQRAAAPGRAAPGRQAPAGVPGRAAPGRAAPARGAPAAVPGRASAAPERGSAPAPQRDSGGSRSPR